ncbi:MAG: hypothetical protein ABI232_03230 [Jatrophihabitantaceae bacterium]
MRIYLPATSVVLRTLAERGAIGPAPLTAFAVTPGLREWYGVGAADSDTDELEYAAMSEAARASLRLIDGDESAARRRVVVALDAPAEVAAVRDDLDRGVVVLSAPVGSAQIAAIHVDDTEAESVIGAASSAIVAADLGEQQAQDVVDDAEGFELSWYAIQELDALIASLEAGPHPSAS